MRLKWGKIILALVILILIVSIVILVFSKKSKENNENDDQQNVNEQPTVEKELQILDLESNTRPIAIMINNHKTAQPLQTGLNDAYLVYEIVVEGGITRLLAVFKDAETSRIGTIRSSRHYFLDYAEENDAIYVHFGWSPQAKSDILNLGINNINGMVNGSAF